MGSLSLLEEGHPDYIDISSEQVIRVTGLKQIRRRLSDPERLSARSLSYIVADDHVDRTNLGHDNSLRSGKQQKRAQEYMVYAPRLYKEPA
jgi:hypothetical protein